MLTITTTSLRTNRRRLLGICSAVLIGVAFLSGTLVLGDTVRAGFDQAFTDANAGTDVVVRATQTVGDNDFATRPPLPTAVLDTIAAVDGVDRVAPRIEGSAQIIGSDGTPLGGQGPPTIGASWVDDRSLNPYTLVEGRAPTSDDEIVIDRGSASAGDLALGAHTTVRAPAPVQVEVVGIASFGDEDSIGGTTLVAFTESRARELLVGGADVVTSVGVAAEDGVAADELAERIQRVLPRASEAITGAELSQEMVQNLGDDFLDFFTIFLVVFSGIALLVATFSIHNTFTVVLAQRTRESALLRAVGATRGQVLGGIGIEAAVIGIFAALAGTLAGLGLAAGLDSVFSAAGFDFPGNGLVVELDSLVIAGVIGLVVTLVAALTPALRASRTAPLAALRDVTRDASSTSASRALVGSVLTLGGLTASIAGRSSLQLIGLGAVLMVIGVVVLGPVLASPAARILGALPARLRGGSGALARGNAVRNPRRTASTATALLIGVCVVSLFTVFAASLKASVSDTVAGSLTGDLTVQVDGFSSAGLSSELAPEVAALPGVDTAVGLADAPGLVAGEELIFTVTEPRDLAAVTELGELEGSIEGMAGDSVAVSADFAEEQGLAVGDEVEVGFVDGATVTASVASIYQRPEIVGSVVVPRAMAEPHMVQLMDWMVVIAATPGAEVDGIKAAVTDVAGQHGAPQVMTLDEFATSSADEVDGFLAIVYALLALSIVIALIGIGNTLSLSIHERTRELGLLRAVGQTRRQLRSMVRWESVMVSSFGTIVGVGLGTFIAWAFMRALVAQEGIGSFSAPIGRLAVIVVVGAAVGVVAALRPARRAARMDVLDAIATE